MPQVGFRKQIGLTVAAVLQQAFNAAAGSPTGTWTDDGGYARTVTIRGAWSTEPTAYPLVYAYAQRRGGRSMPAGGRLTQNKRGGIQPVTLHILVRTASADEREQLSDLVNDTLEAGSNSAHVPWSTVLTTEGIELLEPGADRYLEQRQDVDPAHGAVSYTNDISYAARAEYTFTPTLTALGRVALTFTLATRPGSTPLWRSVTL